MKRNDALVEVTAHLIAAISLLKRYHDNTAPTKRDALFSTKIADYQRAADCGRAALEELGEQGEDAILALIHSQPAQPAPSSDALREALKELAKGVFVHAATQVHYSWIYGTNGRDPDFGEAASDYAESFADAYVETISAALSPETTSQEAG